ncbi:MAG TPA: hypothetical protein VK960_07795 [Acidimicrobiia bacterium]|nr:hypothetical protein [Acidimicrobiia bacterium]
MFIQYYGLVDRPFAEVSRDLIAMGNGLSSTAAVAYRNGEALMARLSGPGSVAKTVVLELGAPVHSPDATSVPLSWWATGTPSLFPTMTADLNVAAIGPELTQITFRGTYKPPLGLVGEVLDKAVLHRFAECSVKDFVDRIVSELSGNSADAGTG